MNLKKFLSRNVSKQQEYLELLIHVTYNVLSSKEIAESFSQEVSCSVSFS